MEIYWTLKAQSDLERIYLFTLQYTHLHAEDVLDRPIAGSILFTTHPAIGTPQSRYSPREVRKFLLDDYEIHYEVKDNAIFIVDVWHTKEER